MYWMASAGCFPTAEFATPPGGQVEAAADCRVRGDPSRMNATPGRIRTPTSVAGDGNRRSSGRAGGPRSTHPEVAVLQLMEIDVVASGKTGGSRRVPP